MYRYSCAHSKQVPQRTTAALEIDAVREYNSKHQILARPSSQAANRDSKENAKCVFLPCSADDGSRIVNHTSFAKIKNDVQELVARRGYRPRPHNARALSQ